MWSDYSNTAIIEKLGKRLSENRIRLNLTQQMLAERAGVGVSSVVKIEKGKAVSLSIFIAIIRELGLLEHIEELVPEPGISPILLKKLKGNVRKRVRPSNKA